VNECSRFFVRHGNIDPAMHEPRALSDHPPVIGLVHTSPRPPRGYRTYPHRARYVIGLSSIACYRTIPREPISPSEPTELSDHPSSCRSLLDEQEKLIGPKDFFGIALRSRGLNCTLWVERIGDSAGGDTMTIQNTIETAANWFGDDPTRFAFVIVAIVVIGCIKGAFAMQYRG